MATMVPPTNDVLSRDPFPASAKIYVEGSDPSIRVPFRAITLTDGEIHTVHDTSGPFRKPTVSLRSAVVTSGSLRRSASSSTG